MITVKKFFILLLALELFLFISVSHSVNAGQDKPDQIPKDFAYPEPPSKTELKTPIKARSLSGKVADSAGFPIPKVLVERVSSDWKERLDATFTDSEGTFVLPNVPMGKHFLKLSKPGFNTLLIRVITTRKSKAELELHLIVST
jgi:hypothetical protein